MKGWVGGGEVPKCEGDDPLEFPNESKLAKSVFALLCAAAVTNMRHKKQNKQKCGAKQNKSNKGNKQNKRQKKGTKLVTHNTYDPQCMFVYSIH